MVNWKDWKYLSWLALIPTLLVGIIIRTRNLPLLAGKYLIELDSYSFFRYSKMFYETGYVPAIDMMRYVPNGSKTTSEMFFPKFMAYTYKLLHIAFHNLTQMEWTIIYPVVVGVIGLIVFFLFVKDLFNDSRLALLATAFLTVVPAYLYRTGAGFADHDALGMLLTFLTLLFFVKAWKTSNIKWKLGWAELGGIAAGCMAATFGCYIFIIYGICFFVIVMTLFVQKLDLKQFFAYFMFISGYVVTGLLLGINYKIFRVPGEIVGITCLYLILFLAIRRVAEKVKIPIPYGLVSIGILAPIAAILNWDTMISVFNQVTKQVTSRLFYTVSENMQPYFVDSWWGSFSFIIMFGLVGMAIYFYRLFQTKEYLSVKAQWWASIGFLIFITTFICGRYSRSPAFNSIVTFFSNTYFYWLAGFIMFIGLLYLIVYYKDKAVLAEAKDKWHLVFLIILTMLILIASRGQIRLLFGVAPFICIAGAYFIIEGIDYAMRHGHYAKKAVIPFMLMLAICSIGVCAWQSSVQNSYSGPMVPGQWEASMDWIRTSTPINSVFAHWWDYGYMTLALGERAVIADGGNERDWNYYLGRYVMTGKTANETLTYLYSHNVTHLLFSWEEILKYPAFSFIGDQNGDRASSIGIFGYKQTNEGRTGNIIDYAGQWDFDSDLVYGQRVFSKGNAGIVGFTIYLDNNTVTQAPIAHIITRNGYVDAPVSCIAYGGSKTIFTNQTDSISGCVYVIQNGVLWLSAKTVDTTLVRLYLFNEGAPYFNLSYNDGVPLAISSSGNLQGPIKIWHISYPAGILASPALILDSPYG